MNDTVKREGRDRLFGQVRAIRADARALLGELERLSKAASAETEDRPGTALQQSLTLAAKTLEGKGLRGRISNLEKLEKDHPDLERYGDRVGAIRNALQATLIDWPSATASSKAKIDSGIAAAKADLDDVVLQCLRLTVPEDVERQLTGISVGKSFDFEAEYKAELPDQAVRTDVLAELSQRGISGWVDLKSGLIYKLSPDRAFRIFTYISPLFAIALSVGLLIGIANLGHLGLMLPEEWNLDSNAKALVGSFVLVLIGAILHLLVENIKQFQTSTVPILAIGDFFDWLHLRWVGIAMTVVPLLVIVIGMHTLGTGSKDDEVALYIAAGYGADSIAGLFLTRFDSSAGANVNRLTKLLKGSEDKKAGADPA